MAQAVGFVAWSLTKAATGFICLCSKSVYNSTEQWPLEKGKDTHARNSLAPAQEKRVKEINAFPIWCLCCPRKPRLSRGL